MNGDVHSFVIPLDFLPKNTGRTGDFALSYSCNIETSGKITSFHTTAGMKAKV
jgi:hypothetical protein